MEGIPISTSPHNLPAQLIPIVGREKEIADLVNLLGNPEARAITLYGFGGTGKTRLAVETGRAVLERFPEGVWFVALAPLHSADSLLTAIATAMGFAFSTSVDQEKQLFNYLQQKSLLLIFDNIEHLLPDATLFLEELLENAPQTWLLVTSRQPLNTEWEWAYPLGGLNYRGDQPDSEAEAAPAVKLFLQHVRRRGQPLEEWDLACAVQVSQLVNGLPLGLLLAASWGRSLGCKEIITEIQRSVGFLRARDHVSTDKHGSMQAVFDYSWQLLSSSEQDAACKLSIFRGGFDREAASAVAGAELSVVATLVDHAFLERVSDHRYQIHELVRQFLLEKLIAKGSYHATCNLHLHHYTSVAQQVEPELLREQQYAWIDRLKLEIDNISAALEWCLESNVSGHVEMGLQMIVATRRLWILNLWTGTGAKYLFRLLACITDYQVSPTYGRALALAGRLALLLENLDESRHYIAQAQVIGLQLTEHQVVAEAYYVQSLEAAHLKQYEAAALCAGQALDAYREVNYEPGIAQSLISKGRWELYNGNPSAATADLSTGLILARKLGDVHTQSFGLLGLAEAALLDPENLQPQQSRVYLQEALEYARRSNDKFFTQEILSVLGEIARLEGQFEKAVACYEESLAIERKLGQRDNVMLDEENLAFAFSHLGRYDEARILFRKNLELALKSDHLEIDITYCLLGLAGLAVTEGKARVAAKVLGSIDALKETILFFPADRDEYERMLAAIQAQLPEKQFKQLFKEGQALSLADAAQLVQSQGIKEKGRDVERLNQLTKREIEILRLVAQGLSDAQVAEQLVLSPRTVNAHLTSIYNKLGVNSRVAATRFAIEKGLV